MKNTMDKDGSAHIQSVMDKVDDFFADEMGPVAMILCEEAKSYWLDKCQKQQKNPGLRNMHIYVNYLAQNISDEKDKKRFMDRVYSIESLKIFKSF